MTDQHDAIWLATGSFVRHAQSTSPDNELRWMDAMNELGGYVTDDVKSVWFVLVCIHRWIDDTTTPTTTIVDGVPYDVVRDMGNTS